MIADSLTLKRKREARWQKPCGAGDCACGSKGINAMNTRKTSVKNWKKGNEHFCSMQWTLPIYWVKTQWIGSAFFEQFELKLVDWWVHDFLSEQAVEREDNEQLWADFAAVWEMLKASLICWLLFTINFPTLDNIHFGDIISLKWTKTCVYAPGFVQLHT